MNGSCININVQRCMPTHVNDLASVVWLLLSIGQFILNSETDGQSWTLQIRTANRVSFWPDICHPVSCMKWGRGDVQVVLMSLGGLCHTFVQNFVFGAYMHDQASPMLHNSCWAIGCRITAVTSAAKSKGLFQCSSAFGKKPDMEVVGINLIKHNPSCSFTGACATMRHQTILPDVSNLMTPQPADCSSMPKLEAGKRDVLRSRLFRHKPHINSITPKHRSHTSSC